MVPGPGAGRAAGAGTALALWATLPPAAAAWDCTLPGSSKTNDGRAVGAGALAPG